MSILPNRGVKTMFCVNESHHERRLPASILQLLVGQIPDIQIRGYRTACATLLLGLLACATNSEAQVANLKPDTSVTVRIQICLPTKRIYFTDLELDRLENHPLFTKYSAQQLELAPKTIRRITASSDPRAIQVYGISFGQVLNREGQFSDGSGFMPIKDSTLANQPVYEAASIHRT
jgi:hypothetical protein